jgi:hypothetical protein
LLAISDATFSIFETLLVFFDHQHILRIHHVLRVRVPPPDIAFSFQIGVIRIGR